MVVEGERARAKRLRQRLLFGTVADLYDSSRPSYSDVVVDHLVERAELGDTSRVLEVGCGTGQLTRRLAARGVLLTAIDIAPSMVTAAPKRVGAGSVTFHATSFEELETDAGSFDLIVSADAFHWVDPELRFAKTTGLLRPGSGWLAVLSLQQVYDEPLRTALQRMWVARSDDGGAWLEEPRRTIAEAIGDSGLFRSPVEEVAFSSRVTMDSSTVLDLENTRATSLGWRDDDRRAFTEELGGQLMAETVELTQVATVTMAQTRRV